jgi:predicted ArsR family transcriptional regulator
MSNKQSTRDVILDSIKSTSHATVEDLATVAGVSPVTVRHHLNSLQADGLIESESVRRHVGRPYYVYSLTANGQELFPKKYFALSVRLLDELKERFPQEVVEDVFKGVVNRIADDHRGEFEHLAFEDRLDYLVGLLEDEGFLARWEKAGDKYEIVEYSCPLLLIGQHHGEVCHLDTTLIETVMQTSVEQHSCMLNGDNCCKFSMDAQNYNTIKLAEVELS